MKMVPRLTLDDACVMMGAAEAKAREIGVDMDIAITDDGGSLLMFHRMDNARITSIDIAISKAFTAAAARKSTRAYGETSQPG
ncbi:MAG: heme-binding protein, partial [Syntrophaceae bacterium]|nr:heme-binding protein [Syntrophaceae bacterium]